MTEINREEWRIKRLTKKITLTEIGKAIGCTHANISQFEDNKSGMIDEKIEGYMKYIEDHDNRKK